MRIGVTGSRNMTNYALVEKTLRVFDINARVLPVLIEGGAQGADRLARTAAQKIGWRIQTFEAKWGTNGRAAGPIRNQEMIDSYLHVLIAFSGGRGTADMVARATKAGVPVFQVVDPLYNYVDSVVTYRGV
jgi:predicted polyphosphate/ATP-dependent NAD kinase